MKVLSCVFSALRPVTEPRKGTLKVSPSPSSSSYVNYIYTPVKTHKWESRDRHLPLPRLRGGDGLRFYLSWNETCVHTFSAAAAKRFNASLHWHVVEESQNQHRVWRESQTLGGLRSPADRWNSNPPLRPTREVVWVCEGIRDCMWIPSRCFFVEFLVARHATSTAHHFLRNVSTLITPSVWRRDQGRWSDGEVRFIEY